MSGNTIALTLSRMKAAQSAPLTLRHAVIAGWTGRDRAAVETHIEELAALGVKRPASVPVFYRTSAARVTTANRIEVLGNHSSGEVEFVLLQHAGELWLGVGSDHTDRNVESYDVGVSKQMCEKPVGVLWWALSEVAAHWDKLILRAYAGHERTLYQEGSVTAMLEPTDLIARYTGDAILPENTMMFCGTLAALGGVRPSSHFAFELEDPVLGRKIRHEYSIDSLPIA
ncbi:MAG TPA: DUF2848 domain-containing protein [Steroidobacteraceae bacterium]|nr:DUF2848 domain-containing protein [Steroidobacteraceae bacterium]